MNDRGRSYRRNRRASLSIVAQLESLFLLTARFGLLFVAQPKSGTITVVIVVVASLALGFIVIVPQFWGLVAGGIIGGASVAFLLANAWWFHL